MRMYNKVLKWRWLDHDLFVPEGQNADKNDFVYYYDNITSTP